jgi:hypothetical protein
VERYKSRFVAESARREWPRQAPVHLPQPPSPEVAGAIGSEALMNLPTSVAFHDDRLGRQISGSYVVENGIMTVTSDWGVKTCSIGRICTREGLDSLARILLRELAWDAAS